jgi:hypothetical protein
MEVDMIMSHSSFENLDIFSVTDLSDQVSTSFLNISCQNFVSIFSYKDNVDSQSGDGVKSIATALSHRAVYYQTFHHMGSG